MNVSRFGVVLSHEEYADLYGQAQAYVAMQTRDTRRQRILTLADATGIPVYVGPKASDAELGATEEALRSVINRRLPTDPVAGLAG